MSKIIFIFAVITSATYAQTKTTTAMVVQKSMQKFEVSRKTIEKEIQDPLKQLSTFTASPSFADGFFSGIEVSSFSKNCLLPKFGIQNGDTVEMINGTPLRFPTDIMEVGEKLSKAKKGSVVRVNIRRNEKSFTNSYLVMD